MTRKKPKVSRIRKDVMLLRAIASAAKVKIIDKEFGDGYFIFRHGKGMCVQFRIKQCKGWLFGIWWSLKEKDTIDFFAQYEKDIDKFKPSCSQLSICDVPIVCYSDMWTNGPDKVIKAVKNTGLCDMINYIRYHKYRAWVLDHHYFNKPDLWSFKESGLQCWWAYFCDAVIDKWDEALCNIMTWRTAKVTKKVMAESLINGELVDRNKDGWICFPRFKVYCDGFKTLRSSDTPASQHQFPLWECASDKMRKKIERACRFEDILNNLTVYKSDHSCIRDIYVTRRRPK